MTGEAHVGHIFTCVRSTHSRSDFCQPQQRIVADDWANHEEWMLRYYTRSIQVIQSETHDALENQLEPMRPIATARKTAASGTTQMAHFTT